MMFQIKINNQVYDFEEKITLKDLAKNFNKNAIIAKVNNRLRELNYYINYNIMFKKLLEYFYLLEYN